MRLSSDLYSLKAFPHNILDVKGERLVNARMGLARVIDPLIDTNVI